MKLLLGLLGIIAGVALGIYVGLWLCFIGGIFGLVTAVTAIIAGHGIMFGLIGWSIVKIMLASLAGYLSAIILIVPSYVLLKKGL